MGERKRERKREKGRLRGLIYICACTYVWARKREKRGSDSVHVGGWINPKLMVKIQQYTIIISSTHSKTWTTYTREDRALNTFHLRNILCIYWQNRVPIVDILFSVSLSSTYIPFQTVQTTLVWSYLRRGWWPHKKAILLSELTFGRRDRKPPPPS